MLGFDGNLLYGHIENGDVLKTPTKQSFSKILAEASRLESQPKYGIITSYFWRTRLAKRNSWKSMI